MTDLMIHIYIYIVIFLANFLFYIYLAYSYSWYRFYTYRYVSSHTRTYIHSMYDVLQLIQKTVYGHGSPRLSWKHQPAVFSSIEFNIKQSPPLISDRTTMEQLR